MMEEARKFNEEHPEGAVSWFACRYPGLYKEAASALRQVRKDDAGRCDEE